MCWWKNRLRPSSAETAEIEAVAQEHGVRFHAGHNFMGLPSYDRLKDMLAKGELGRVSVAEVHWCLPLAPLRSGPFGIWLLREPKNLLLELGPHLMGFIVDLFGVPDIQSVQLSKAVDLPGDDTRHQAWRIMARAGDVDVTLTISMVETIDDRSLTLRGSSGRARLDFAADTLVIERENASDLVLNPLRRQLDLSWQHLREGLGNTFTQVVSLNRKSPYALSFQGMDAAIYDALRTDKAPDARFSGDSAVKVMTALESGTFPDPSGHAESGGTQGEDTRPKADCNGDRRDRVHRSRADPRSCGQRTGRARSEPGAVWTLSRFAGRGRDRWCLALRQGDIGRGDARDRRGLQSRPIAGGNVGRGA